MLPYLRLWAQIALYGGMVEAAYCCVQSGPGFDSPTSSRREAATVWRAILFVADTFGEKIV